MASIVEEKSARVVSSILSQPIFVRLFPNFKSTSNLGDYFHSFSKEVFVSDNDLS